MMNPIIVAHLGALRELMEREHLSACIFPSSDAHQSEYTAEHWKGREWISGFNGSAGVAVVTLHEAALWTDSRYFLAAETQLEGTEFQLMKEKLEHTPTIAEWLGQRINGGEVAIDGLVSSFHTVMDMKEQLRACGGMTLRTNLDPLVSVWTDRPSIPDAPVVIQPLEFAGEDTSDKITCIRMALRKQHVDGMLVSALDDIAWILNLRGTDVHCTPVFVAYLLITSAHVTLFVNPKKLTAEVRTYLHQQQVVTADYADIVCGLEHDSDYNILMDGDETSYTLYNRVQNNKENNQGAHIQEIIDRKSPVPAMKAVKNPTEIACFHRAMQRDGVALVKFLKWLKPAVAQGGQTEMSIDRKLTELRSQQPLYRDLSFDTIAGYQTHGAIVHYEATPDTDATLKPEGLLLLDSGAQYQDATTDITRTIALGPVTAFQKHIYTLVLKGHIQLELVKFPQGATGTQLDILAREAMWREGLNYLHGTGHGVGSYLSVHEGPHQIRMEWKPTPLVAGMTVTDEPGIYLSQRFGVRTENTVLITPYVTTEFGDFLQIEPLTLCPIDTAPIEQSLLNVEEKEWLNTYHQHVYQQLSPSLDDEEKAWLKAATQPITI